MRTLVPTILATALTFTLAVGLSGQEKEKAKGKGGPRLNLKVLPDDANLIPTMQSFVAGLGLADKGGCNFCHVQDRSSDEKMEKVMARMMISMAKDINAKFPDGKQHVPATPAIAATLNPRRPPKLGLGKPRAGPSARGQ